MSDVGATLVQVAAGVGGAWWWYVDRVRKIDARRAQSWAAWIGRPLREPPPWTDWDAFEARVARELAAEAARAEEDEVRLLIARRTTDGERRPTPR